MQATIIPFTPRALEIECFEASLMLAYTAQKE
jgi:hypothetical protein